MEQITDLESLIDALPPKAQKQLKEPIQRLRTFVAFAKTRVKHQRFLVQFMSTGQEKTFESIEDVATFIGVKPHSFRCMISGLSRPIERLVSGEHVKISRAS